MKKKLIIFCILLIIIILSIFIYINLSFNPNIPVLAYHDVLKNPTNETDVDIDNFKKQMKYLYKHNYKTLSLNEFYDWKNGKKIKGKKILLTFDDGNESFYTKVLPILEKYNFKATIFVIGSAIDAKGYLSTNQIIDLNKNHKNIDVESHSYNLHIEEAARSNNYDIYNNDMKINSKNNYKYYAYPFGIRNDNYIKALKDNNYKMAFIYSPSKWTNRKQNNYIVTRVPIYKNNSLFKFKIKVSVKF